MKWFIMQGPKQQIITAMVVAAMLLLLVVAILLPLHGNLQGSREVWTENREQLADVQQLAGEFRQLKGRAATFSADSSLTSLVNRTLQNSAIQPVRIQQNSTGELLLRFEDVEFSAVLQWLQVVEQTSGIMPGNINMVQGTAGRVSMNLTLQGL